MENHTLRTRTKILIAVAAALVYFYCQQRFMAPCSTRSDLPKDLDKYYSQYNSEFFNDTLPRDVVIDWGEYNTDRLASTSKLSDGRFHIAFNEQYTSAGRVARLVLLHEQCHIATWSEQPLEHGPRWRTCMLNLYQQGAFKADLIDGHEGN